MEDDYGDDGKEALLGQPPQRRGHSTSLVVGLLLVSNVMTFILASQLSRWIWTSCEAPAASVSKEYLSNLDTSKHTTTFTGLKFVPNEFAAVAGGDVDVDAAWASIGTYFDRFLVTKEEALDFPELTSDHVFLTPDSIVDSNVSLEHPGYPVFMEAFHQLHCTDLMRQALYFNADYYRSRAAGPWALEEKWIQNHIQHCLDYLRQLAMCHADTGLIAFHWLNEKGQMSLDYRQERQCGNFDSVLEWAKDHEIDMNGGDVGLKPPPGATFQTTDSHHGARS